MTDNLKLSEIVGTRPEIIKTAPVIRAATDSKGVSLNLVPSHDSLIHDSMTGHPDLYGDGNAGRHTANTINENTQIQLNSRRITVRLKTWYKQLTLPTIVNYSDR